MKYNNNRYDLRLDIYGASVVCATTLACSDTLCCDEEIANYDIVSDTVKLTQALSGEQDLRFGQIVSDVLEIGIITEAPIEQGRRVTFGVEVDTGGAIVPLELFAGFVGNCVRESKYYNQYNLTCYDDFTDSQSWNSSAVDWWYFHNYYDITIGGVEYVDEKGRSWHSIPMLHGTIISIMLKMETASNIVDYITAEERSMWDSYYQPREYEHNITEEETKHRYWYVYPTNLTYRTLLSMAAEALGAFVRLKHTGAKAWTREKRDIEFFDVDTSVIDTTLTVDDVNDSMSRADVSPQPIDGISVIDSAGNRYNTNNSAVNPYIITNNLFLGDFDWYTLSSTNRLTDLAVKLNNIYTKCRNWSYDTADIELAIADIDENHLGSVINWEGTKLLTMTKYISGPLMVNEEITATGDEARSSTGNYEIQTERSEYSVEIEE